jgi:hypothetical protein
LILVLASGDLVGGPQDDRNDSRRDEDVRGVHSQPRTDLVDEPEYPEPEF